MTPAARDAFRARLKELGLTQADLARRLGVSRQVVSYYVNGERVPSLVRAVQIESITGTPPRLWVNGVVDGLNDAR